jgi:hypothetical protein
VYCVCAGIPVRRRWSNGGAGFFNNSLKVALVFFMFLIASSVIWPSRHPARVSVRRDPSLTSSDQRSIGTRTQQPRFKSDVPLQPGAFDRSQIQAELAALRDPGNVVVPRVPVEPQPQPKLQEQPQKNCGRGIFLDMGAHDGSSIPEFITPEVSKNITRRRIIVAHGRQSS